MGARWWEACAGGWALAILLRTWWRRFKRCDFLWISDCRLSQAERRQLRGSAAGAGIARLLQRWIMLILRHQRGLRRRRAMLR